MRRFAWVGVVAAVQLGGAVGVARAAGGDPRVGAWKLVAAQCAVDPANKLSITSLHDGVHVVMSGETHLDFTAKWDGHDAAVPGNAGFNQVVLRRIDKRQGEVTEKKDGAVVATVRDKLSSDGSELTITTAKKGRADQIGVWVRSGGVRDAKDLFAGEWTEDMSKSRMRQGMALKIGDDGGGGVRFAGEYSYTARFDGKAYDVRDSVNDTVTLALVDARTVDAIYKRDDQVTQRDRWLVSADGQEMTVTTTGTLENGQRVSEKLVFERQ